METGADAGRGRLVRREVTATQVKSVRGEDAVAEGGSGDGSGAGAAVGARPSFLEAAPGGRADRRKRLVGEGNCWRGKLECARETGARGGANAGAKAGAGAGAEAGVKNTGAEPEAKAGPSVPDATRRVGGSGKRAETESVAFEASAVGPRGRVFEGNSEGTGRENRRMQQSTEICRRHQRR